MIKSVFWVALGAAGALELDRWLSRSKTRLSPSALTGSALDKLNERLESRDDASTDVRTDRI